MKKNLQPFVIIYMLLSSYLSYAQATQSVSSPDKKITATFFIQQSRPYYSVQYNRDTVIEPSLLGFMEAGEDYTDNISLTGASAIEKITDHYSMRYGKKKDIAYA